jgi:hypothetical protein
MLSLEITGSPTGGDRSQKARALREFIRSIRSVTAKIYQISADDILKCLQKARLHESDVPEACLAGKAFSEDGMTSVACGPSCNSMASSHLATAAHCYAAVAVHSVAISDLARAFRYYRRAAHHCRAAAEMDVADGKLLEAASEYAYRAATLRQHLAKKRILRRKLRWAIPVRFR